MEAELAALTINVGNHVTQSKLNIALTNIIVKINHL